MPASGGAELSIYSVLRYLAALGHRIVVVTRTLDEGAAFDDPAGDFSVARIPGKEALPAVLDRLVSEEPGIGAVITQNLWCDVAILWGRSKGIPVIYFLRSPSGGLDVSVGGAFYCPFVLGNSPATVAYLADRWKRHDARLVPAFVNHDDYRVNSNTLEYITLINPIMTKGGAIFRRIAEQMPARRFLAVEGWAHLKKHGKWDLTLFQDLARGYNEPVHLPDEVDFSGLPNVVVHPTVVDMRRIYSQTRLLLVPSIVPDAAPRVALEAMLNGIPVIASSMIGNPKVISHGGTIIGDYGSVDAWLSAIECYDNPDYYLECSTIARAYSSAQDPAIINMPLLEILAEIERTQATRMDPGTIRVD